MGDLRPAERRDEIMRVLSIRRHDKIENLANEFGVSVRTIKYDIEKLSLAYPIYTMQGKYDGGVYVDEDFRYSSNTLRQDERELLERLSEQLTGNDAMVMERILSKYAL